MNWITKGSDDKKEKRFCVSNNKVKTAYKNEGGPGYFLKRKTLTGIRKVPIKTTIFKTEEDAKKSAAKSTRVSGTKKNTKKI